DGVRVREHQLSRKLKVGKVLDQFEPVIMLANRSLSNGTLTSRDNVLILATYVLKRVRVEIQTNIQLACVARNVFQLVNRLAVDLLHSGIAELRVSSIGIV